jgi:hypothetical protein
MCCQAAARGTNASNPKQGQLAAKINKPVSQSNQREEEPLRVRYLLSNSCTVVGMLMYTSGTKHSQLLCFEPRFLPGYIVCCVYIPLVRSSPGKLRHFTCNLVCFWPPQPPLARFKAKTILSSCVMVLSLSSTFYSGAFHCLNIIACYLMWAGDHSANSIVKIPISGLVLAFSALSNLILSALRSAIRKTK